MVAPVLFAKMKGTSMRMCINYRMTSQVKINNWHVWSKKLLPKINLRSRYHQMRVKESGIPTDWGMVTMSY